MPLNLKVTLDTFDKWEVDFLGPIKPQTRRTRSRYKITVTYYLKRWAEEEPVTNCSAKTIV